MRLGLSIPLGGLDLTDAVDLAVLAEELGYHEAWSSEIGRSDGFSLLAAIAARTTALALGVGVVPVQTRPPALLAMSASTVDRLSRGRFRLGLGASTAPIVRDWMGLEHDVTLARMQETIEAIRIAMAGGRVDMDGTRVRVRRFRLQEPDPVPVPILIGALGPRMRHLAGSLADGVVLSHVGRAALPAALRTYRAGLRSAARAEADAAVVHRVGVVLGAGVEGEDEILRREVAAYGRIPAYRRSFVTQGFGDEAQAIARAWDARDADGAARAVSEPMLDELFVRGDEAACHAAIAQYARAGVTTLVLIPIALEPDPRRRAQTRLRTLRELAPASAG